MIKKRSLVLDQRLESLIVRAVEKYNQQLVDQRQAAEDFQLTTIILKDELRSRSSFKADQAGSMSPDPKDRAHFL